MFYIGSNVYNWPLEAQRGLVDGMFGRMQLIRFMNLRFYSSKDMKFAFVSLLIRSMSRLLMWLKKIRGLMAIVSNLDDKCACD